MISPTRRLSELVLAVAFVPSLAHAQSLARTFKELQRILKPKPVVVVIDTTGQETRGRVAEIAESSLALAIPETSSPTAVR